MTRYDMPEAVVRVINEDITAWLLTIFLAGMIVGMWIMLALARRAIRKHKERCPL